MDCQKLTHSIYKGIPESFLNDQAFREMYFSGDFRKKEDCLYRRNQIAQKSFDRKKLMHALMNLNQKLGASEKTIENIQAIAHEDTLCVVTGQQAGVFGGPLYTLYKAATAIKQAKIFSDMFACKVVPIFWIASEDHDFEEIRRLSILDKDRLKTLKIDKKPGWANKNPQKTEFNYRTLQEPVGWTDVNESAMFLSERVESLLEEMSFGQWAKSVLTDTLKKEDSLADWFGKIYLKLFETQGLIVFDPMDSELRSLGKNFIKKALDHSDQAMKSVYEIGDRLKKNGCTPALSMRSKVTGLYLMEKGERKTIFKDEQENFFTQSDIKKQKYTQSELIKRMEEHPEDFSTNVVWRPVIQDVYLPTLAYVAGPGEMAYYAQLKDVYSFFDMEMPLLIPRENYTYRRPKEKKMMEENKVSIFDVLSKSRYQLEQERLEAMETVKINSAFFDFNAIFNKAYSELVETLGENGPEIKKLESKNRRQIENQLLYLEKKAKRFHRKKHKEDILDIKEICNQLCPYEKIQERTLGIVNLLGEVGPDIIPYLVDALPYSVFHRLLDIDSSVGSNNKECNERRTDI